MKRTAWMWLALPIVLVTTACGGDEQADATPAAVAASSAAATAPASSDAPELDETSTASIADGTYTAQATRAEAEAAGFTEEDIERAYGPDGALEITLKFSDGQYSHLADYIPGVPEVGDGGTFAVAGDRLTLSNGDGDVIYRWTVDGDVLSVTLLEDKIAGDVDDIAVVRLMTEHDFTRTD